MKRFHLFQLVALVAVLIASAGQVQAAVIVVDSINESASPAPYLWSAPEVGWFYTPTFSYDLAGVRTKFGNSVDSRTVTVEVYNAHPESGGTLLRSADFAPLSNAFAGGEFAPLSLVAKTTYFFGFRNVGGSILNINSTEDFGATNLGVIRFSFVNDGSYSFSDDTSYTTQPIVQFLGQPSAPPAVPEPSMMVIGTLFGLGGLVAKRRMKK